MPDSAKPKILIVGGAGYVGGHLPDLLAAQGYPVAVYDNLTYEERYSKAIPFIHGDVRERGKLEPLFNEYDAVIWLAAVVGDEASSFDPLHTTEINRNSVGWLVEHCSKKIIFMSTCSVYGVNDALLHEDPPTNPLSLYAQTKLEAEKIIRERAKDFLVFRLGTLYGVSDTHARLRLDLVVNRLTKKATLGEPLTVYGGGQWRPLLHVKDVAEAIMFGLEKDVRGLYNLSAQNYRIRDITEEITRVIPGVSLDYHNLKFEDLRNYKVTSDKFRTHGWAPKYTLEYGIREIHRAIKERRIKQPDDKLYSNAEYLRDKLI